MSKYTIAFCLMLSAFVASAQTNFRSNGTGGGFWNNTSTWQVENPNGSGIWIAASSTPTSMSGTIEIQANDVVTVSSNVTIDQTTIDANGTISVSNAIALTLASGANSLVVNGNLNMLGESNIKGSGFLIINGNLKLGSINSTGALVRSTSIGNVRNNTTNRTYNAGAQITYAGTSAQIIGNGHPTTSDVITEINNASGVSFTTAAVGNPSGTVLIIPGDLILTSGDLNIVSTTTARSLTLNGNLTANSNHITFSGVNSSLTINGSGSIGNFPFPSGGQAIKNLVFNRTSGSVTFNNDLTISGTVTISNGSVTLGGNTSIKGATILSSGTTLAFDGQSLSLAGDYNSSGILSASGASTLSLTGSTALTSPINFSNTNKTLNSLIINKTNSLGTSVKIGASGLNVTNTLTLTDGVFDASSGLNLSSGSTFNFGATGSTPSSISNTPSGGPWTLNYSGSAAHTTGPEIPVSGILNGLSDGSTGTITLNQSLTIGASGFSETAGKFNCGAHTISTSSLTIDGGNFIAPSGNLTISGDISIGGIYTNNSGTIILNGSTPQSIFGSNATSALFNSIKINSGATLIAPDTLNIRGDFTNNGTFNQGTHEVIFSGSSAQSISGSNIQFYDLTINKSTNPVTIATPFTVTDTLYLKSGSISNSSNKLTIGSGAVINRAAGTITGLSPMGAPWNLLYTGTNKTTALEIPSSGNVTNLTVTTNSGANVNLSQNISASTLIVSSGSSFTGGAHNITVSTVSNAGTFVAPTSSASVGLTLNGDFTNNGSFTSGSGTVVVGSVVNFLGTVPVFNNLSISSTGTLVAPSSLTIQGNFKNDGTFNAGNGIVIFSGDRAKQINGSVKIVFKNITVQGGTSVTDLVLENSAGADLSGILNIDDSINPVVFDTDGASGNRVFTVLSTSDLPTSDGSIGVLTSGSTQLPGKITVQRYMSKTGLAKYDFQVYRDISSPVNTTVSDLQNSLPVTGPFTNSSIVKQLGSTDPTVDYSISNLTSYDETVITDSNGDGKLNRFDGYLDFPADNGNTVTAPFSKGQGYTLFIYGSDDPVDINGNAKWSLSGQIWSGTFNLPVSYTPSVNPPTGNLNNDGWNLVGNPYPSTIDWAASSGWTKTNIATTISIDNYNTATGSPVYATYNSATNLSTNGGSRYIATGQGFWVHATAVSPILTISENVKVAGTQTSYLRQSAPQDVLRLTLSSSDNLFKDETLIHFNPAATAGFDEQYDAVKLMNRGSSINLSTLSPNQDLFAINSLPFAGCATTIQLDISSVRTGSYSLSFEGFSSMPSSRNIQLKDNFNNLIVDVKKNQNYTFSVDEGNALTFGSKRFSVIFSDAASVVSLLPQNLVICDATQATVTIPNSVEGYQYSILGQDGVVLQTAGGNGKDLLINVPTSNLAVGANDFKLSAVNSACTSLSSESTVSVLLSQKPKLPLVTSATSCGQGSVKLVASGGSSGDNYNWYNTIDSSSPILSGTSESFVTPQLDKSQVYYVSISNSYGCEGARVAVSASIVNLGQAEISIVGINTLQSNYSEGNQWFVDGAPIVGATERILNVDRSGEYKLQVSNQGCVTSAERSIKILTDNNSTNGVNLYPNPVKGLDKLTIETISNERAFGEVYNTIGQKISDINFNISGDSQLANYYFSQENKGVYFFRVIQGNKVSVFRVVKE